MLFGVIEHVYMHTSKLITHKYQLIKIFDDDRSFIAQRFPWPLNVSWQVIRILKELKQKYPDKELDQLVELANYYALLHQQKSRAFYRVQATRMMIGAGNVLKKHAADHSRRAVVVGCDEALEENDLAICSRISFESTHSQCMENCGTVMIPLVCRGGLGESTFYVDYCTEDGTSQCRLRLWVLRRDTGVQTGRNQERK